MSLLAAIVPVNAPNGRLPWLGRVAQAWFLAQVRRVDPVLASALHGGQSRRPYTIGILRSEERYVLRVTSLSAILTDLLIARVLPDLGAGATFANIEVRFGSPQIENHPWARRSDYEQLARTAFADSLTEPLTPGFEFGTPTTFHSGGLNVPLPLPSLVYGSLIQAWNTFSPVALPVSLQPFVADYVAIARHRISTRSVKSGDQLHVGFTGTVRYALVRQEKTGLSPDEYRRHVQVINLLAQFAFYAGVGAHTSMGMGQARPHR